MTAYKKEDIIKAYAAIQKVGEKVIKGYCSNPHLEGEKQHQKNLKQLTGDAKELYVTLMELDVAKLVEMDLD